MSGEDFIKNIDALITDFRALVPNPKTRYVRYYINAYGNRVAGSTGNMALNATKLEYPNDTTARIFIDDKIAPYVHFTVEPWNNFHGRKNPNENWFETATDSRAGILANRLNGTDDGGE